MPGTLAPKETRYKGLVLSGPGGQALDRHGNKKNTLNTFNRWGTCIEGCTRVACCEDTTYVDPVLLLMMTVPATTFRRNW